MQSNKPFRYPPKFTHEGGQAASHTTPLDDLKRSVLTCLLWEDTFYEKGSDIASRMASLVKQCAPSDVAGLAYDARQRMYLRHVPLFLIRELARAKGNGSIVAEALAEVIQRPDELCEYLAIYWKGQDDKAKESLSAGSKRGLAKAFAKFNEYSLAKYDRDNAVKLRDVIRLVHAKPKDEAQSAMWKRVIKRELATPDTWEVALSAGKDNKKEVWERLLRERKLGALAFLRNLRNMTAEGVDTGLIRQRFAEPLDKVLPFRFIAAYRTAPMYAQELNDAMLRAVSTEAKLPGKTYVIVDVSGSMDDSLSSKSDLRRIDAASALAVLMREICDVCRVFTFSENLVEVPAIRGLGLIGNISRSQQHGGTYLARALDNLPQDYDRIIVITDEQTHDTPRITSEARGYLINVGSYRNGLEIGKWTRINGWSERVVDFMREYEK